MLPAAQTLLQASIRRLPATPTARLLAAAALLAVPHMAQAQDVPQPDSEPPSIPAESVDGERRIGFEADELGYDAENDIVTARGNVIARSGDQSVRADSVSWNRLTGDIVAEGDVRVVDEDGNQLFTERVTLTDELKAGAMANLLLAFRQGGRLAADMAERDDNGDIILDKAVYSSCAVVDAEGCPRSPSWRVTAERVTYDAETERIRFQGAYLELFGARILPLPGLVIRADGSATTGVMIPDIGLTASNGFELTDSYYWRIADNRDLLLTGYVYTGAAPMVSAQYRQLGEHGAFQVTGYGTYSTRIPLNSTTPTSEDALRGYIFANGRYQLDPNWSVTGSVRVASDRTFLRRYDISREDRLRSTVNIERIDEDSYLSLSGWATQALLVPVDQGQVPLALPLVDYRKRLQDPIAGGSVNLQLNTLAITRAEGQDTQRAFARAQWDLRRITPMGQEVTLTGLVRGDVYHSDQNELTQTISYRGQSGWQARGVALAALDIKWPFIGEFLGGSQILTPRVQFVATPDIRNLDVPNEDARAIDLEDSNLFALNRFPGYDRVEEGARVTYGVDWQASFPNWRLETTIGQSYRLTDQPTLFPDGTGLNEQWSDFVGRTTVRYRDFLKFTHRFRLDKDNFAVRRNEIDATLGNDRTYVELGYLRLNRDIDLTFEDLQDREELRAAGRIAFARYWSVFGSAVVNLTNREEDPTFAADGFEPLRTRLGIAYADDCLELGFTWRRDYIELADARRGDSFRLYFALRNLGFR
ncbi:LPS-assembly protein LptD [Alteraurantiacibacter aquimixticola]|uniref:LPS-assembly protein LptD n=1 Tax=Alteraurantiacibacter aquimixticola TaxID=2489173 RepID=A0A4T3F307_9SPHN|nr:LPS assembly protein LptD [Alteraurantiacibacter aquimixticola]TIX51593.1 LPS-assembly protein LptD [Alteraurantiacibacter aquimixticola]